MDNEELNEIIEEILTDEYSFPEVKGVNKSVLIKFIKQLSKQPIDFKVIPIGWILYNIFNLDIKDDVADLSVRDCLVDKDSFEFYCEEAFHNSNPVIYELINDAAEKVEEKLVTYESKREYLTKKIREARDDDEKEYYVISLQQLNEKENKGPKR